MNDVNETTVGSEEMKRVIDRVQKLLTRSKTSRGNSESEAETAMRLAQDLMSKYNLDMAEIEAASTNKETAAERVKEETKGRAMYKWQRQLAKYVAEANFCYHIIKSGYTWVPRHWSDEEPVEGAGLYSRFNGVVPEGIKYVAGRNKLTIAHVFVGRKANVITAQLMYNYLTQAIEDAVPVENNAQRLSRSAMSWKEGCADRLCERLAKKRKDLIEKHDLEVKAEQERVMAEYEARQTGVPKQLEGNPGAEVKAAIEEMGAEAYDSSGPKSEGEDQERPEPDKADSWNPADAQKRPEGPATTSMVLASVYDEREREANWEKAHDLPPGWLAQRRADELERDRKQAEEDAKRELGDVEKPIKEETEKQRLSRERREAEEASKQRLKWARENERDQRRFQREWAKKDHAAYYAGASKGDAIGIDVQIGNGPDVKRLKS